MADVTVDPECTDPKELYGQGVRAFVLQDYENAVAALSKASELLVIEHKDDLHDSLAEVYLYYGKSLLGLSREQNEALGDAVPKNSAEDSEDEEEEGAENGEGEENKTEENGEKAESSTDSKPAEETKSESKKEDDKETRKDESKMEINEEGESSRPIENGEAGPSSSKKENGDGVEEQNGDDDGDDLQLAWEVLELAKKIFQRLDDKKNLADTLIVLGEVSMESENFESAISDIKQGLEIQKELFAKDSRTVAETLYKLGMAYTTNSQIDEAVVSFNSSLDYLKNRIVTLEEIKSMTQEHKDEVEEIKSLIPDIEDKIADMKVYKEEVCDCREMVKQALKPKFEPPVEGAVNRLEVRRKPKQEAASIEGAVNRLEVSRKPKQEAASIEGAVEKLRVDEELREKN